LRHIIWLKAFERNKNKNCGFFLNDAVPNLLAQQTNLSYFIKTAYE